MAPNIFQYSVFCDLHRVPPEVSLVDEEVPQPPRRGGRSLRPAGVHHDLELHRCVERHGRPLAPLRAAGMLKPQCSLNPHFIP